MFDTFRSLRWRLQAWHTLILLCVVAGFGSVLYFEIAHSRWDDVDEELLAAARIVEGALRSVPLSVLESMAQDLGSPRRDGPPHRRPPPHDGPPPHDRPSDPPPRGQVPGRQLPAERRPDRGPPRDGRPGDGPPRDFLPGDRPPRVDLEWETVRPAESGAALGEDLEAELQLPRSLPERLGRREGPAYYVVYFSDGSVLRESNLPDDVWMPLDDADQRLRRDASVRWQRGPYREVYVRGPGNTMIRVGRNVMGEQARQSRLALQVTLSGGAIFLGGLVGGWWLSGRAIAPIARMSRTASKVSETNLSERMDLEGVDRELEELGTVLNQMLDRLDSAFEQQRRFSADASHELRTPLAVILSSTELALARDREPREYREHLEKCHRAATRMHRLVESLLALARLDARHSTEALTNVDLRVVTGEHLQLLEPLAEQQRVTLEADLWPCVIRSHADQVGQVVTNLVSNAIRYNRPGGRVMVTLKTEGTDAVLTVADTGQGISEADQPHLFERFYRVHKDRSRSQGGSGLGLAICQRIIVGYGGTLEVESKLGEGSTFKIRLPLAPEIANGAIPSK
jgi:two-component system OmpR family sensor kinase